MTTKTMTTRTSTTTKEADSMNERIPKQKRRNQDHCDTPAAATARPFSSTACVSADVAWLLSSC